MSIMSQGPSTPGTAERHRRHKSRRLSFLRDKPTLSKHPNIIIGERFRVLDPMGVRRATLLDDGTFVGANGETLGYWELNGSCGDSKLNFIGQVNRSAINQSPKAYLPPPAIPYSPPLYPTPVPHPLPTTPQVRVQPGPIGLVTGREDESGYDEMLGEVDFGRALIRDQNGSTIAEIRTDGLVLGHWGQTCGQLENFTFDQMPAAAAYMLLLDYDFVRGK
mgnify:CR=1 FL=1